MKTGEENCKRILRYNTLRLGGNAILGADLDYSEAGAGKGMLMICMAGTAVKIKNLDELKYNVNAINEMEEILKTIMELESNIENLSRFNSLAPY